jgi:hypothetical protein
MRGSKRSLESLIEKQPEIHRPEPPPRWQEIDARLQQLARGLLEAFLEFAQTVGDAYDEKVWERFGFQGPERYFSERIGIKPRTFRRYLRVQDMLGRLPADGRDTAMDKVARIGSHKAAIIAAAVERDPARFDIWVENAEQMTEEALQERVSQTLGLPARGGAADGGEPGERFARYLLNVVPADRRDQVEWVLDTIQTVGGYRNYVTALLDLVDIGERDLADAGYTRE